MFGLFVSSNATGPATLFSAEIVPVGGGSPFFTVNWTKFGDMTGYYIYILESLTGVGIYNTPYSLIDPNDGTFGSGDISSFVDYTPGDDINDFDFIVSLFKVGPGEAVGSPIYLNPPY